MQFICSLLLLSGYNHFSEFVGRNDRCYLQKKREKKNNINNASQHVASAENNSSPAN